MPSNHVQDYDPAYIEACFLVWYRANAPGLKTSNGQPSAGGAHIIKILPPAPDGRKPNIVTVSRWMERYGWRERADALDAQVSLQLDKGAIEERIKTLKALAESGKTLMDKGLDALKVEKPFSDNPSAAVRAIIAGAEMQFKYAGAADRLAAIALMSDRQIETEILRLLGKESGEPTNENEDTIDGTLEDIPEEDDNTENDES